MIKKSAIAFIAGAVIASAAIFSLGAGPTTTIVLPGSAGDLCLHASILPDGGTALSAEAWARAFVSLPDGGQVPLQAHLNVQLDAGQGDVLWQCMQDARLIPQVGM